MTKYRIAIQEFKDGKPMAFDNVMIEGDLSIKDVTRKIVGALTPEYDNWFKRFADMLTQRQIKKDRAALIKSDLFDSAAVGHDISKEEFLENELYFARRGY